MPARIPSSVQTSAWGRTSWSLYMLLNLSSMKSKNWAIFWLKGIFGCWDEASVIPRSNLSSYERKLLRAVMLLVTVNGGLIHLFALNLFAESSHGQKNQSLIIRSKKSSYVAFLSMARCPSQSWLPKAYSTSFQPSIRLSSHEVPHPPCFPSGSCLGHC